MDKLMKSPAIMARVQASMDGLHALDTDTRVVLSAAGVKLIQFVSYHSFARALWGITNRVSGPSVADEARALMAKWVARGLSPEVLRKVAAPRARKTEKEVPSLPEDSRRAAPGLQHPDTGRGIAGLKG